MFTWPDGSVYSGTFQGDKMTGKGTCIWTATKNEYDGQWTNGKKNGFGTMVYGDKSVYSGSWANDKRNGEGKMVVTAKDGSYTYEGEWLMD